MIKKIIYSWQDINHQVADLAQQIVTDDWRPDYIVGIVRGGAVPATMLSHFLGIKMFTLDVRLRDSEDGPESNAWMAEDAYGYDGCDPANILIVDDINDSGATINWIKQDWMNSCTPNDPKWQEVWHKTVRFAVLTNNLASPVNTDYWAKEVNKAEDDCWLVYPWEEWWKI